MNNRLYLRAFWLLVAFTALLMVAALVLMNGDQKPKVQRRTTPPVQLLSVQDEHGHINHLKNMDLFMNRAAGGQTLGLRVTHRTIEGDPIYHEVFHNSGVYTLKYDTTQDKFGAGGVTSYSCKRIVKEETPVSLLYKAADCKGTKEGTVQLLYVNYDVEKQDRFDFVLKYGVAGGRNVIDTVQHRIVKELLNGETASADDFQLTKEERQQIYKLMVLAGYLTPKEFDTACKSKPDIRYDLTVYINSATRSFQWSECGDNEDDRTMRMLVRDILTVLEGNAANKRLPAVKGQLE